MRRLCDSYLLDSASLASPAMDNVCWHAPVFPGDVLSARSTVMASRPMASQPGVGLVQSKRDVLNQHGVVMLSMQGWGMCRRRVPAACACCVCPFAVPAA